METGAIKAWQISASSGAEKARPDQARLNLEKSKHSQGIWIAKDEDYNAWLQVYFPQWYILITAVATQGLEERSRWVTMYKLQHWRWRTNVQYYKDPKQSGPFKVIIVFYHFPCIVASYKKRDSYHFMATSVLRDALACLIELY